MSASNLPIKDAKIVKISSTSAGITIPSAYIENGLLAIGQIVDIEITTKEDEE